MATLANNPNGSLENVLPQLPPEPEQDLSIHPLPEEIEEELEPKDIFIDKAKSIINKNIKTTIEPVEEEKPKRKRKPYKPRKKREKKKVAEPVKNIVETVQSRPHPKVVKQQVKKPLDNDGKKRYTMEEFFGFMEAYDRFNKHKNKSKTKQDIKQNHAKPTKPNQKPLPKNNTWRPMVLGNKDFFNI